MSFAHKSWLLSLALLALSASSAFAAAKSLDCEFYGDSNLCPLESKSSSVTLMYGYPGPERCLTFSANTLLSPESLDAVTDGLKVESRYFGRQGAVEILKIKDSDGSTRKAQIRTAKMQTYTDDIKVSTRNGRPLSRFIDETVNEHQGRFRLKSVKLVLVAEKCEG